jgi:uncharacterized protein YegL
MPSSLEAIEFAENSEARCPCILLLDTSGSMSGEPIAALNRGLKTFKEDLLKDNLAKRRVEVAIVTFNSEVNVVQDFVTIDRFEPPTLEAQYQTHTGSGVNKALDLLQGRKAQYRNNGITYYRPWVFMVTDGEPYGEADAVVNQAAKRIKEEEANKRVAFFAVGIENADMESLSRFSVREPIKLKGLNFQEMFVWLSASMQSVSQSQPGDQVALAPPGWGAI